MMTAIWFLIKSPWSTHPIRCVWYALSPVFGARLSTKATYVYEGSPQLNTVFRMLSLSIWAFLTIFEPPTPTIELTRMGYSAKRPTSGHKTNLGEFDDDQSETAFVWIGHLLLYFRWSRKLCSLIQCLVRFPHLSRLLGANVLTRNYPFR